jgi:hypothetical protein
MSIIAIVAGFVSQDFDVTFKIWVTSLAIVIVACVPDWPVFNKNPVAWVGKGTTATRGLTEEELMSESQGDKDSEIRARVRNAQRRKAK